MLDNKYGIIALLIFVAIIFSFFTIFIYSEGAPTLSAKAAALYEPESETFIYTKNETERLAMASTTKIMTGLIALEKLREDEMITIDEEAVGIEGSSIYLEVGEMLSAKDLVYALLLQSANDAAVALALKISGDIDSFAELMNERARSLGLNDTCFKNPHGLDAEGHYTTAHDLAIISAEALKNDSFKAISSTYKKDIESSLKTRKLVNHNKLLKSYDGCIGLKTGYTKKSGRSLVSAAERNGLTLIAVTIDAPSDWSDHKALLDTGYSVMEATYLASKAQYSYTIPVMDGEKDTVTVSNAKELKIINKKGAGGFDAHVKLSRYCSAPVKVGDILGTVIFTQNEKKVGEIYLTAEETVKKRTKKGFFSFFEKEYAK